MRKISLEDLHSQLRANFRPWDEETDALCKRVLKSLLGEIGAVRLEIACNDMMAKEQFFREAYLRRHIPPADYAPVQRCDICRPTNGWAIAYWERGKPFMARCQHDGRLGKYTAGNPQEAMTQ